MTYRVPVVYKDGKHEPMDTGIDQLDTSTLPIAPMAGNQLRVVQLGNAKGLFVGAAAVPSALYISSVSGIDAPNRGTSTDPFQTVDYAIQALRSGYAGQMPPVEGLNVPEIGVIPTDIHLVLKAGEVFSLTKSYQFTGKITITFYDDVNYGSFNSPTVGGKAFPATMTDLARPVLNLQVEPASANGITHFKGLDNMVGSRVPTLTLLGVTVNLPAGAASNSDYQDLLTAPAEHEVRLQLIGARINKLDTANQYGAIGLFSRARATVEQYASQFLVQGLQVQAGAANDALVARTGFIKFYPERLGNSQLGGMLNTGYPPTGSLTLQWSNCNSELVIPGKTSQATYPQVGDPSFGLAAYFTNLLRDTQSRPLNCICPALL